MSVFDKIIDFFGYFAIVLSFYGVVLVAIQGAIEKKIGNHPRKINLESELREFLDLHSNYLTDDTKQEMIDEYLQHRKEANDDIY